MKKKRDYLQKIKNLFLIWKVKIKLFIKEHKFASIAISLFLIAGIIGTIVFATNGNDNLNENNEITLDSVVIESTSIKSFSSNEITLKATISEGAEVNDLSWAKATLTFYGNDRKRIKLDNGGNEFLDIHYEEMNPTGNEADQYSQYIFILTGFNKENNQSNEYIYTFNLETKNISDNITYYVNDDVNHGIFELAAQEEVGSSSVGISKYYIGEENKQSFAISLDLEGKKITGTPQISVPIEGDATTASILSGCGKFSEYLDSSFLCNIVKTADFDIINVSITQPNDEGDIYLYKPTDDDFIDIGKDNSSAKYFVITEEESKYYIKIIFKKINYEIIYKKEVEADEYTYAVLSAVTKLNVIFDESKTENISVSGDGSAELIIDSSLPAFIDKITKTQSGYSYFIGDEEISFNDENVDLENGFSYDFALNNLYPNSGGVTEKNLTFTLDPEKLIKYDGIYYIGSYEFDSKITKFNNVDITNNEQIKGSKYKITNPDGEEVNDYNVFIGDTITITSESNISTEILKTGYNNYFEVNTNNVSSNSIKLEAKTAGTFEIIEGQTVKINPFMISSKILIYNEADTYDYDAKIIEDGIIKLAINTYALYPSKPKDSIPNDDEITAFNVKVTLPEGIKYVKNANYDIVPNVSQDGKELTYTISNANFNVLGDTIYIDVTNDSAKSGIYEIKVETNVTSTESGSASKTIFGTINYKSMGAVTYSDISTISSNGQINISSKFSKNGEYILNILSYSDFKIDINKEINGIKCSYNMFDYEDCKEDLSDVYAIKFNASKDADYENWLTVTVSENAESTDKYLFASHFKDTNANDEGYIQTFAVSVVGYVISGTVWQESNGNNIMDDDEVKIKDDVILNLYTSDNEFVDETTPDSYGFYEFSSKDIVPDKTYYILAELNNERYSITAKSAEISDISIISSFEKYTDSDGIIYAKSNDISVIAGKRNYSNNNLGLTLKKVYTVSLAKYIIKAEVINKNGISQATEFGKTNYAKLDIKDLADQTIKITYLIEIENTGYYPGYVNAIKDYLPGGTNFNPSYEENINWQMKDGYLINSSITDKIDPGEKIRVPLVLEITRQEAGSFVNLVKIDDEDLQLAGEE